MVLLYNQQTQRGYKLTQLTFKGNDIRSDIEQDGYSLVSNGIEDNDAVDELIESYARFTDNLPDPEPETMNAMIVDTSRLDAINYSADKQPEWHKYRTNHPQPAKPGGYTNRSLQIATLRQFQRDKTSGGNAITDDPKEYYHFHPNSLGKMAVQHQQFGWGKIPPEVLVLNMRFARIHELAYLAIKNNLSLLEESHPELTTRYITPDDLNNNSPIRLVFYHLGQGDILAGGHYDKSAFTMQVAESHMGLRVQNPETGSMIQVRRPANLGVAFPGFLWRQMYPDSQLSPTWHDVINLNEINDGQKLRGQNCARWALIWFCNTDSLDVPQISDTHSMSSF